MRRAYELMLALYPPEYRQKYAREMALVFEQIERDHRVLGTARYLHFLCGEIVGVISAAAGIWACKTADQALRRASELFPIFGGIVITTILHLFVWGTIAISHERGPRLEDLTAPAQMLAVMAVTIFCFSLVVALTVAFVWKRRR